MRKVLIRIVLDDLFSFQIVNGVPLIGAGWLLTIWVGYWAWWAWNNRRAGSEWSQLSGPLITGLAVVIAVAGVAPRILAPQLASGLPVFGYGSMLFVGFVAGGFDASRRSERIGLAGDTIWDMAIWLFIPGVAGGRLFYLIQYHEPMNLASLFRLFGKSEPKSIKVDLGVDLPQLKASRLYFLSPLLLY